MSFILTILGIASAVIGGKKVVKGIEQQNEAKRIMLEAQWTYNDAEKELLRWKDTTTSSLVTLGKLKLEVWDQGIGRFMCIIENVGGWDLYRFIKQTKKKSIFSTLTAIAEEENLFNENDFRQMQDLAINAADLVIGGSATLATGSLLAIAAYNGVTTLGIASTGTAIGTLSGIAAENATLAWLGGGALASGGAGIAGGISVLGGIVLSPILAIGGAIFESKTSQNLGAAMLNLKKAKEAAQQMNEATAKLIKLNQISNDFHRFIEETYFDLAAILDDLESIINSAYAKAERRSQDSFRYKLKKLIGLSSIKVNPKDLNSEQKTLLKNAFDYAGILRKGLLTPILDDKGEITAASQKFLSLIENGEP